MPRDRDTVSIHLRLPRSLHKRLQKSAKQQNVSLNTEMINRLESATRKITFANVQALVEAIVRIRPDDWERFRASLASPSVTVDDAPTVGTKAVTSHSDDHDRRR